MPRSLLINLDTEKPALSIKNLRMATICLPTKLQRQKCPKCNNNHSKTIKDVVTQKSILVKTGGARPWTIKDPSLLTNLVRDNHPILPDDGLDHTQCHIDRLHASSKSENKAPYQPKVKPQKIDEVIMSRRSYLPDDLPSSQSSFVARRISRS